MVEHEDGFCDECGADMRDFVAQLTVDGRAVCITCATAGTPIRVAKRPEARDDGR